MSKPVTATAPAAAPFDFSNVSIHTVEHIDAPLVVSSQSIMQRLGLKTRLAGISSDKLERVTGIKERRVWHPSVKKVYQLEGCPMHALPARVAAQALTASGVPPERIGVVVNTSVSRRWLEPSIACVVHQALGLPASTMNFDVTNACMGLFNGMCIVGQMIETGIVDYGLIVDVETMHKIQEKTIKRLRLFGSQKDFREQMAALTLGEYAADFCCGVGVTCRQQPSCMRSQHTIHARAASSSSAVSRLMSTALHRPVSRAGCGGVAMIMCRSDLAPPEHNHRFTRGLLRAASHCVNFCYADMDRLVTHTRPMRVEGRPLFRATWEAARAAFGWEANNIDYVVPHQVTPSQHSKQRRACD